MNRFSVLTGIPDFTKGLVRELRVRWALEEMDLPYEEIRYPHPEIKKEEYKKKQPFGQVPYFTTDELCMFETGAILLHLAQKHLKLLPENEVERARVYSWMFSALNSVEPFIFNYFMLKTDPDATESTKYRAQVVLEEKLRVVAVGLGDREFFGASFSIADIIMTSVLKTAQSLGVLGEHKNLAEYIERNESRPPFRRALSEHLKLYE